MKYSQEEMDLWKRMDPVYEKFPKKCVCILPSSDLFGQEVICMGVLQNEGHEAIILMPDGKTRMESPYDFKLVNTNYYRNENKKLVLDNGDYYSRQKTSRYYQNLMIDKLKHQYPLLEIETAGFTGIRCINKPLQMTLDLELEPKFLEGEKIISANLNKWSKSFEDISVEEAMSILKKWNALHNFR